MEFGEKLQELRKNKGLTQEELAEALFVSRTAISKWESGRGYPNIDSLKEISKFFSVSIDDLLSGEKLISIAQQENKRNIKDIFDLLFGITDIMTLTLILLPLYPKTIDDIIYSVNLLEYSEKSQTIVLLHWIFFTLLVLVGILKVVFNRLHLENICKPMTIVSMVISIILVLFLAMTREAYAIAMIFLLLVVKGVLLMHK